MELCYRACKTDLAMESPRFFWENRLKLLLMVRLPTLSCCPCWTRAVNLCSRTCYEIGATELESGTATPRYRFLELDQL